MAATMLNEPRKLFYELKRRPARGAASWFDLRVAQHDGLEFWQTINNAIILHGSIPADCLVKVAKRNLDNTEAEVLCEEQQPEDWEFHRVILKENSAAKSGED